LRGGKILDKKRFIVILAAIIFILAGVIISLVYNKLLVDKFPWLLILSAILGIILAIFQRTKTKETLIDTGQILRHKVSGFVSHWVTALGIITLLVTGFIIGFLFFPHFANTPASVLLPLNIHFWGILIATFGGFYFLSEYLLSRKYSTILPSIRDITQGTIKKYLFKKTYKNEGKYLASQKSAFLVFALLGGILFISGAIKVTAHSWEMPSMVLAITTQVHDIFALLFLIMLLVHTTMALLLANHRILIKSWFTGKINEEYVKEEHSAWYEELKTVPSAKNTTREKGEQI
jgi:formate dehydrogenase gamma subunit